MGDARCVGSLEATLPASRIPPPEKCATPLTIGYSFPHTGQPSMPAQEPEHADRPEAAGPLDTERAEAHHPSARVANHEKVKLQPLAEMEPPRVEPFPGEKY